MSPVVIIHCIQNIRTIPVKIPRNLLSEQKPSRQRRRAGFARSAIFTDCEMNSDNGGFRLFVTG